jgi:hypothetical protein
MDTSGPRPHSGNTDIWTKNNQGYIVSIHKRLRRALFTPFNTGCPINTDQLEDYRKTIIRQPGKEKIIIEDDYQQKKEDLNKIIEGSAWIGETWFQPKSIGIERQHVQSNNTKTDYARASEGKDSNIEERRIETSNKTLWQTTTEAINRRSRIWPTHTTTRSNRQDIRLLDKRRTSLEESPCGTKDILLLSRVDIRWTRRMAVDHDASTTNGQQNHNHSQQWTGSTNFEEKPSCEELLEEDEEDNQQAIKARATSMPKQPTAPEIMEHNLTHMPYRSWCPICIQRRGRSDAHPHRSSSRPIIQIHFAFLKVLRISTQHQY